MQSYIRIALLALVALGVWALARYGTAMPRPLPSTAQASEFSAGRAEKILGRILGPEIPHPAGTDENARVHSRILDEYGALGIPTTTYHALGCLLNKRFPMLACATVTDVIANVVPGVGKAIVMLSHTDSVPAGPGASDDESGTAAVIESARAIEASGTSLHPVMAVNTDGEEFDLLGAAALLDNPKLKARVGAVVNVEARGNQGPSILFQMSPGDGRLLEIYANNAPTYETSSLTALIYKLLPNDTDLTLFIRDGFPSWNFAYSGNVAHYHTALDRRSNLDPSSLQMQGDSLLGVARGLEQTKFEDLKGGDSIYISVLGRWLPRMPASFALPLSLLALVMLVIALAFGGNPEGEGSWAAAFAVLPVFVVVAGLSGLVLHLIAATVSGQPDPSYAYPSVFRIALALAVLAAAVLVSRFAGARKAMLATWIWYAALAVLTAIFLTGLSPYFLFPLLIAAPLILLGSLLRVDLRGAAGTAIIFLAALPAVVIWLLLVSLGETIRGLYLHPVFTVPAAFGMVVLVPLLAPKLIPRAGWIAASGALAAAAILFSIAAGFEPAFSAIAPQRLSINYVEDWTTNRAFFDLDASAPLPAPVRATAHFSSTPVRAYTFSNGMSYSAPAGTPHFSPPSASVKVSTLGGGLRRVILSLKGSTETNQILIAIPKGAGLKAVSIDDKRYDIPAEWAQSPSAYDIIGCFTRDCATRIVTLDLTGKTSVRLYLSEIRYGLPPEGAKLVSARPKTAVQSQNGDTTMLINSVTIPPV